MNYKDRLISILTSVDKYSCPEKINFHSHTIHSDGSLSPMDLYIQANDMGLEHLAITDHHSVQAYKEIIDLVESKTILKPKTKLWTGVEITGLLKGCLVHIIGLGFDIESSYLKPYLNGESQKGMLLEAKNIVSCINKSGGLSILAHPARYKLSFDTLIQEAHLLGFDGVEVWYDYERSYKWKPSDFICEKIYNLVRKYNMLPTCGTDTHGISLSRR